MVGFPGNLHAGWLETGGSPWLTNQAAQPNQELQTKERPGVKNKMGLTRWLN